MRQIFNIAADAGPWNSSGNNMKPLAIFVLGLAALLSGHVAAKAEEACSPIDIASVDPSTLPGRKAWIWAESVGMMVKSAKGFASAPTMKQNGPISWFIDENETVPYGEPAEILKYEPSPEGLWARTTVKLQDGRQVVVPGPTVHLYEFWQCTARQLLEVRRVPTKDGRFPFNEDVQWTRGVWVRLIDKTTAVEKDRLWMKPAEVAKVDLMLCKSVRGPLRKVNEWEFDLAGCNPITPTGWGTNISLDPKAVETVSPTSMKILLGS
jgi:hypothetical protein